MSPEKRPPLSVLVVDDDPANLESIERILERDGIRVFTATGGRKALEVCRRHNVEVVLSDLMMPGMNGLDLLKALKSVVPGVELLLMTAFGTVETAVAAMREGAYDYVEKPLQRAQILRSVRKAAERGALRAENASLKAELNALKKRAIVGNSAILRQAMEVADQAAPSTATVLVLGQSGTGKELLARHIHARSRRDGEFIAVNLAALPETIVESELFGHEKGAFTGANQKREGRIAQAAGGTLFLDEVGELSAAVQVKLLRVLQEGEYEPLGGRTAQADFRLVAATNRDLLADVKKGRFREDLYYRLNVIAITSPELRQRGEDIPLLVDHFVETYCRKNGKPTLKVAQESLERLYAHDWPGNVRELQNVVERAVVLCRGDSIEPGDLPTHISNAEPKGMPLNFTVGTTLEEIERHAIRATLEHTDGDKRMAAQLLGIATRTIYRKLDAERQERDAR